MQRASSASSLTNPKSLDNDRRTRGQLAKLVGDDGLVGFAALLGSFCEFDDGFLAMATTSKFASAFGSHIILGP